MEEHSSNREELDRKCRRFTWVSAISFLLMALLSSLSSFFVWVLGGTGVYFGFLAVYNFILSSRMDRPFQYARNTPADADTQQYVRKHLPRVILLLVAGFAAAMIFVVSGNSGEDASDTGQDVILETESSHEFDRQNPDEVLEAGNRFYNDSEYDSALVWYDRALALRPGFKEAYYNKALVHSTRQDYSTALSVLERCLAENPNYGEALQLMANCYYSQNQPDQALTYFQRAYDAGTRNADLSHYLGYLNDEKNNSSLALQYYKEAIGQDSSKVDVYKRLAELEPDRAAWYLSKAREWGGN